MGITEIGITEICTIEICSTEISLPEINIYYAMFYEFPTTYSTPPRLFNNFLTCSVFAIYYPFPISFFVFQEKPFIYIITFYLSDLLNYQTAYEFFLH